MKSHQHITINKKGFSLLELMVVIVLMAGLMAVIIPGLNALSGMDIKNEVTRISALTREIYAKAALSGKTHRVVFDLEAQQYWPEEKTGDAGVISPELGYEELMKERVKERTDKREKNAQRYTPQFKAVEGRLGEKYKLPSDMVIHGVWTEQMTDISRSGQVAIYFFSGGYTQQAFVSLAPKGDEDNPIFLALSPLTGEVEIDLGEPLVSEMINRDGEK